MPFSAVLIIIFQKTRKPLRNVGISSYRSKTNVKPFYQKYKEKKSKTFNTATSPKIVSQSPSYRLTDPKINVVKIEEEILEPRKTDVKEEENEIDYRIETEIEKPGKVAGLFLDDNFLEQNPEALGNHFEGTFSIPFLFSP